MPRLQRLDLNMSNATADTEIHPNGRRLTERVVEVAKFGMRVDDRPLFGKMKTIQLSGDKEKTRFTVEP